MRTILCCLLLLCVLALPARAQNRSPGPPEWLVEAVDDVQLGVRLEGGFLHSRLSIAPLEERGLRYLDRPVSSEISPVTTPVYGVGVGLRLGNRAELFGAYRLNEGLGPEAALQFQSGGRAIPSEYDVRQWEIRAQYFILDNAGFGAIYRDEYMSLDRVASFTIAGEEISDNIFSVSSERRSLSLYVPAHFQLGDRATVFGRLGASIYGRSDDGYGTRFTFYQDPEQPGTIHPVPPNDENAFIDVGSTDLSRQFARLGIEHPFFGLPWRFFLTGERVSVGDTAKDWRGGAHLQVGLPF